MAIPGMKTKINFSNRKYIYIALAAIVIIISAIVTTLLLTGRDKNVKDLYFQIERKHFINRMNEIERKYNDSLAKTRPLREQPSRTRYEISMKLSQVDDGNNNNGQYAFGFLPSQAIDIINSSKIVVNSRYDIKNEIKTSSLSFLLEGQSFLDINAFWDKDLMGIQVPVIYDKYFVFNKNDLSSALGKFGIDIPIKKIILPSDLKTDLKSKTGSSAAPAEIRNIIEDYIKLLEENIPEEQLSVSRNIDIDIDTGSPAGTSKVKCDVFTIELDESQFKAIAAKTAEFLCSDIRFLKITLGQLYSMLDILKEAGYLDLAAATQSVPHELYWLNGLNGLHKLQELQDIDDFDDFEDFDEDLKDDIEKLRQALLDAIKNTSFPGGFSMMVAVDKKGNIVDRKATLAAKSGNEPERAFNLHSGQYFTNIHITQEAGNSQDEKALIEIETQRQAGTGGSFTRIHCENNFWPDFEALINARKETDEDDKNKAMFTSYLVDIKLTCKELGIENRNILIDIKKEDRYGISFQLPERNESTAIDIITIDEDAINNIQAEIQFSALRFILANQYLIDAFTAAN